MEKRKKTQDVIFDEIEPESIFHEKPEEIENWRGLAIPQIKSRCKTSTPLYILQNGNVAMAKTKRLY